MVGGREHPDGALPLDAISYCLKAAFGSAPLRGSRHPQRRVAITARAGGTEGRCSPALIAACRSRRASTSTEAGRPCRLAARQHDALRHIRPYDRRRLTSRGYSQVSRCTDHQQQPNNECFLLLVTPTGEIAIVEKRRNSADCQMVSPRSLDLCDRPHPIPATRPRRGGAATVRP